MRKLIFILLLPINCSAQVPATPTGAILGSTLYVVASAIPPVPTMNIWAWYEGDLGVTQVSNAVSQWADQSGNGRHLIQATGTAKPTWNGTNAISFDGTSDYMTLANPISQQLTICMIVKLNSTAATQYFGGDATAELFLWDQSSTKFAIGDNGGVNMVLSGTGYSNTTTYYLVTMVFNGSSPNSSVQVNNDAAGTGTLTTNGFTNPFTLGAVLSGGIAAIFGSFTIEGLYIYQGAAAPLTSLKAHTTAKFSVP